MRRWLADERSRLFNPSQDDLAGEPQAVFEGWWYEPMCAMVKRPLYLMVIHLVRILLREPTTMGHRRFDHGTSETPI